MRVFDGNWHEIETLNLVRDAEKINRLIAAPNAQVVRTHSGRLVKIRLLSVGDDRGHSGERHGNSNVTTERVRNGAGVYVGTHLTLKHKAENVSRGTTTVGACINPIRGPLRPPMATK